MNLMCVSLLSFQTILEEEYQESFGLHDHSESVPSMLGTITPPRMSDPPRHHGIGIGSGGGAGVSRSYRHHSSTAVPSQRMADSIYNEPCDAKRAVDSSFARKSAFRRASLAASIYCDTEHHQRSSYHAPQSAAPPAVSSSPQGE